MCRPRSVEGMGEEAGGGCRVCALMVPGWRLGRARMGEEAEEAAAFVLR